MPALITRNAPRTNLVPQNLLPKLPTPVIKGAFSMTLSWEGDPTASLTIEGILERELTTYRAAYQARIRERIDIYEVPFYIASYSEAKLVVNLDDGTRIETYTISVQFSGWWSLVGNRSVLVDKFIPRTIASRRRVASTILAAYLRIPYRGPIIYSAYSAGSEYITTSFLNEVQSKARTVNCYLRLSDASSFRLEPLGAGRRWQFGESDILYTIQTSVQEPPTYQRAVLGEFFKTTSDFLKETAEKGFFEEQQKFIRVPSREITLQEGDLNLSAPGNRLKDLNSNFDISGPRKSIKTVTIVDGITRKERVEVYGFAYLASNISNSEEELDGPTSPYWTKIEEYTTTYIYEPLSNPYYQNPEVFVNGKTVLVYYVAGLGLTGFFQGPNYLTKVVTSGWKLGRFQQENLPDIDSRILEEDASEDDFARLTLQSLQFRQISFDSQTTYDLNTYFMEYPSSLVGNIPFTIQRMPASLFSRFGFSGETDDDGYAYFAIPDPNFANPMMILKEESYTNSFESMNNPNNIDLDPEDPKEPALTVGEEGKTLITRKPYVERRRFNNRSNDLEMYTEYSTTFRAQDPSFISSLDTTTFREIQGRPPAAQSYRPQYEPLFEVKKRKPRFIVEATTDLLDPNSPEGESRSITAETIDEAIVAARADLLVQHLTSALTEQINLAYFHPFIREGDYIELETSTISLYPRRVLSVSFTVNFDGVMNGVPRATCDGTALTVGEWRPDRTVSTTVKPSPSNNDEFAKHFYLISRSISGGTLPIPRDRRG